MPCVFLSSGVVVCTVDEEGQWGPAAPDSGDLEEEGE